MHSTFDKVPVLKKFLQTTIEKQLRSVFVEDLPRLVHVMSRQSLQRARESGGSSGRPMGRCAA